jgi:hypothetical protein
VRPFELRDESFWRAAGIEISVLLRVSFAAQTPLLEPSAKARRLTAARFVALKRSSPR